MEAVYGFFGGRKMVIGVIAVIGIVVLVCLDKIPAEEAVKWITGIVVGTSASIAIEDGMAQVGSKQKNVGDSTKTKGK